MPKPVLFNDILFTKLSKNARSSERLRYSYNLHSSYTEPCQKLLNAIEPGSYIQPHRHVADQKDELLIVLKGAIAFISFEDRGLIKRVELLTSEVLKSSIAVTVPYQTWHTVVSLKPDTIILEVKSGPFNPLKSKELAFWAPNEKTPEAENYQRYLKTQINKWQKL